MCNPGLQKTRESKPAEEMVHHPSGVISEVLRRVAFALPACPGPKSTLQRTSEMPPPDGSVPFSLLAWIPLEARIAQCFHLKSPQMAQNSPKLTCNPLFSRYLSCSAIICLLAPPHGPKRCFFNTKMGAALKKYGFWGRTRFHKKIIALQVGGRGPGGCIPGPPPPPNVHVYKLFVESSTTPKTHIFLTRLPFWG